MARVLQSLLFLVAALVVTPSRAEVYRCDTEDGGVRFVDSPHACPKASAHRHDLGRAGANIHIPEPDRGESPAPPPAAANPSAAPPITAEAVLLARAAGWDVVEEVPEDPSRDPDLVRWGVREKRARHYTRVRGTDSQVCSIEVWIFRDEAQARMAHGEFAYPDWQFAREGTVIIATHATTLSRERRVARRAVFSACVDLQSRTRVRAAELWRRSAAAPR